jgi:hypothetical protein
MSSGPREDGGLWAGDTAPQPHMKGNRQASGRRWARATPRPPERTITQPPSLLDLPDQSSPNPFSLYSASSPSAPSRSPFVLLFRVEAGRVETLPAGSMAHAAGAAPAAAEAAGAAPPAAEAAGAVPTVAEAAGAAPAAAEAAGVAPAATELAGATPAAAAAAMAASPSSGRHIAASAERPGAPAAAATAATALPNLAATAERPGAVAGRLAALARRVG